MLKRTLIVLPVVAALLMSATVAFAAIPPHPKWQSSAKEGTWNHDNYSFQNNMWSCPQPACHKQTIWANTPNDWGVESNMAAGNTAVLTFPDIGQFFGDKHRVSAYHLIRNGFTESMPRHLAGLSTEAADDVWLNDWGIEMMIWVDNIGRSLAGSTRVGNATIFGQHFTVWKYGNSELIFDLNHNEQSGETHILASIDWLIKHHQVPATATLTEVQFGWEIASTHGQSADFKISKYWAHTQLR
jgi:hypothetical protein